MLAKIRRRLTGWTAVGEVLAAVLGAAAPALASNAPPKPAWHALSLPGYAYAAGGSQGRLESAATVGNSSAELLSMKIGARSVSTPTVTPLPANVAPGAILGNGKIVAGVASTLGGNFSSVLVYTPTASGGFVSLSVPIAKPSSFQLDGILGATYAGSNMLLAGTNAEFEGTGSQALLASPAGASDWNLTFTTNEGTALGTDARGRVFMVWTATGDDQVAQTTSTGAFSQQINPANLNPIGQYVNAAASVPGVVLACAKVCAIVYSVGDGLNAAQLPDTGAPKWIGSGVANDIGDYAAAFDSRGRLWVAWLNARNRVEVTRLDSLKCNSSVTGVCMKPVTLPKLSLRLPGVRAIVPVGDTAAVLVQDDDDYSKGATTVVSIP